VETELKGIYNMKLIYHSVCHDENYILYQNILGHVCRKNKSSWNWQRERDSDWKQWGTV